MFPLKGLVCTSGVEACYVPCWSCRECDSISYVRDSKELDLWISEYTEGVYTDPEETVSLFENLDNETLKLIELEE
jgi:hypothetical protein